MSLQRDNFWEEFERVLIPKGWVLVDGTRYDPTVINGVTPGGRSFTLVAQDDTITLTVAGRTRTVTRIKEQWEDGSLTVAAMEEALNLLPANQR